MRSGSFYDPKSCFTTNLSILCMYGLSIAIGYVLQTNKQTNKQ